MNPTLWEARRVAARLGIKLSTVYALCRHGDLPHIRVTQGKRALIRFDPSDIERFLQERRFPQKTAGES